METWTDPFYIRHLVQHGTKYGIASEPVAECVSQHELDQAYAAIRELRILYPRRFVLSGTGEVTRMKFSLLMATKNRPLMAIKAIEAVILQSDTFYNWELVVNDGSKHDLHPALFRFPDPRIKWHHDAGRTFIEACNEMLQRATGDIFCFVNDDDVMIPGALRYVADNIGDAKWLVGRMLYEDAPYGHAGTLEELMAGNYIPQPAVFWTRDAYDTIGGFDSHLWLAEDYDYWLRLWKAFGPPKFVDGIITAYGVHPGQMTQVHQHEQCLAAQRVRDKHG